MASGARSVLVRGAHEDHQAQFESAFNSAPIGMALIDMGGRWLQVNDALCRITGRTRGELRGTTLQSITHPDDLDRDADSMCDLFDGKIPNCQIEKRYQHAWGHYIWMLVTSSVVRNDRGVPLYYVSQVQDISERRAQATRLEYLLEHDFLTGLFNRRRFQQELAHEAERVSRYGANGAVLMIDLDNFKDVNDGFGHKAGDDLLKGVAGALNHRIRRTDVVARVGGDEFAMLLPETDADQAVIVAQGIVKALGRQVAVLGEQSIHITASVGVALFDGLSAAEVLEFADLAMYEAKQSGRNRVAMYRPGGSHREVVSARLLETELIRTALEKDRLLLYCQPILDLRRNEVCQYELLLRLRTDDGGEPLAPSSFLYVAERFGLIQQFDCWVARQAIALIADHARAGRRLVLHVNLSGKSIGDSSVAALIEEAIEAAGIDPTCLILSSRRRRRSRTSKRREPSPIACTPAAPGLLWTTSVPVSARSTTSRPCLSTTSRSTVTSSATLSPVRWTSSSSTPSSASRRAWARRPSPSLSATTQPPACSQPAASTTRRATTSASLGR